MNCLAQTLVLCAFFSAQAQQSAVEILTDALTTEKVTQFKAKVAEHCVEQMPESGAPAITEITNTLELFKSINEQIKAVGNQQIEASENATLKVSVDSIKLSLDKENNCKLNLAELYYLKLKVETNNATEIDAAFITALDDEVVKNEVIKKLVSWLETQFALEEGDATSKAKVDLFLSEGLSDLYKLVFDRIETKHRNKLASDTLDVVYGTATDVIEQPFVPLALLTKVIKTRTLALSYAALKETRYILNEDLKTKFKAIVDAEDEDAYNTAIQNLVQVLVSSDNTQHLGIEWVTALFDSMKDVHAKKISGSTVLTDWGLAHQELVSDAPDTNKFYLKQVLVKAQSLKVGDAEPKDLGFKNLQAQLQFGKRRDDALFNNYLDNMKVTDVMKSDDEILELYNYTPKKWESLDLTVLPDLTVKGKHHDTQKTRYPTGIINIPVEFDLVSWNPPQDDDTVDTAAGQGEGQAEAFKFFRTVMDELREQTCINFFEINKAQGTILNTKKKQYIKLTKANGKERGCDEIIGQKPLTTIPTIQPFSQPCLKGNTEDKPTGIAHYFMHHLGFDNEHQRFDYEKSVSTPTRLPKMNKRPGHNYVLAKEDHASSLTGTYDIESVMHWSSHWTPSINDKLITHMRAGSSTLYSTMDIQKINNLYCNLVDSDENLTCNELVTQTNTGNIDYSSRREKCLDKNNTKSNIYFQHPTGETKYVIKAKVSYKTKVKKVVAGTRLLKGFEDDFVIASTEGFAPQLNSGEKCGDAQIYHENNTEKKSYCSTDDKEKSFNLTSSCGKPMKLQYSIGSEDIDQDFSSVLKIEDIVYEESTDCVLAPGLVGESTTNSIFKLFTLVNTFII